MESRADRELAGCSVFDLLKGKTITFYSDDDVRLAMSRCVAFETTRGWRIAKEKASHHIDIVVALAMAAHAVVETIADPNDGLVTMFNRDPALAADALSYGGGYGDGVIPSPVLTTSPRGAVRGRPYRCREQVMECSSTASLDLVVGVRSFVDVMRLWEHSEQITPNSRLRGECRQLRETVNRLQSALVVRDRKIRKLEALLKDAGVEVSEEEKRRL